MQLFVDMDGVLGDTEPPCAEAGIAMFRDLYGREAKVEDFAPYIGTLAVIGIVYGALVAMMQPDMKKLVAYSSVAHMGFVTLGFFIFS